MSTFTSTTNTTFTADDVHAIVKQGFICPVSTEVCSRIAQIARDIGYQSAITSPVFPKVVVKTPAVAAPPPTKTVISVPTGGVALTLNKLSAKTYDTVYDQMLKDLANVPAEKRVDVANSVYSIVSGNKAFVLLYATLFKAMVAEYPWLLPPLLEQTATYLDRCDQVVAPIDATANYTEFCKQNAIKERMRTNGQFYVLVGSDLLGANSVPHLVQGLLERIRVGIAEANSRNAVEEWVSLLASFTPLSAITLDAVRQLVKVEGSPPGLSHKAKFALMDLAKR